MQGQLKKQIEINCDMGENDTVAGCLNDVRLMPYISQCNIAVGGHIGTPETMAVSFENAAKHGLKVGLHPSYPDREHFGRSRQNLSLTDLAMSLREQIDGALAIAKDVSVAIQHIKFHGQLYNDLEIHAELRQLIIGLMKTYPDLALMGLADGQLMADTTQENIPFIREAFADRAYVAPTQLQPRSEQGAVISNPEYAARQALQIASDQQLQLVSGEVVSLQAESLCVHSDTPDSLAIVQTIQQQLADHDIQLG